MGEKKVNAVWNHNVTAYENGWGKVALPIVAGEKRPVWGGWQNASLVYDPKLPGYEPEGYDWSGCGVGLRAGLDIGNGYCVLGLDIDVKDWRLVAEIMALVREFLGVVVTREGNAPKILVPVRVKLDDETSGWKPRPIQVGEEGKGYKVEMIYKGKQFVVRGIHPDTGKEYRCSEDVLARGPSSLAVVEMNVLKKLFAEIEKRFGRVAVSDTKDVADSKVAGELGAGSSVSRVDVAKLVRDAMRGEDIHENLNSIIAAKVNEGMDADMVRRWLVYEGIPENLPREQDRLGDMHDDRSELGRMISGAILKWGKGSRWEFLHDGLRGVGSGAQSAQGDFGVAGALVGSVPEDDPFAPLSETQKLVEKMAGALMRKSVGPLKTISTGWGKDPKTLPLTPFLDRAQTYLKGAIMALQGKAGANKSTWALNYVWSLMTGVAGKEFGAEMRRNPDGTICKTDAERVAAGMALKVLYLSADDPAFEIEKRLAAWRILWKVPQSIMDTLDGRFFVHSVTEGIMGLSLDTPEGRAKLRELMDKEKFDIVIGDPAANLISASDGGNDEALNTLKEVVAEVSAAGVAAVFIWHVNKMGNSEGAESKLEDIRGASAIGGAVRGAKDMRFLNDKEVKEYGLDPRTHGDNGEWSYRKLSHTKNSYGRLQEDQWFKLVGVDLLNDGFGSPDGDNKAVLVRVDMPGNGKPLTDADIQEFLKHLWTAAGAKKHYTDNARTKDRDVYAMAREQFSWGKGRTNDVLAMLSKNENITIGEVQLKGRSATNLTRGIAVCNEHWNGNSHTPNELSPFDPI